MSKMSELDALIAAHIDAKSNLDRFKAEEKKLRIELINILFPTSGEGTHTMFHEGFKVKCAIKMNYNIDANALKEWEELFSPEEARVILRKPSLDLTNYRKLDEDDKMWIDDCITVTPGLPSLSIEVD